MGQQVSKPPVKKRSWKQQARIQGLYQMYTESIRLSKLIKNHSVLGGESEKDKNSHKQKRTNIKNKNGKKQSQKKSEQEERKFLQQLLQSFELRNQFAWSEEIPQLFKKHFSEEFEEKWQQSKELFYQLLLENVGVGVEGDELIGKSRIGSGFYRQGSRIIINGDTNNNNFQQTSNTLQHFNNTHIHPKDKSISSFEQYFHLIIKQRASVNIKSSFLLNDDQIDRRKEEEIAEVESQRMTLQEEINFINESIIDAETIEEVRGGGGKGDGNNMSNNNGNSNNMSNGNSNNNGNSNSDGKHNTNQINQRQYPQVHHQQSINNNNYNTTTTNNNNNKNNNISIQINTNDDDQYFLPLITKRHNKHKNKNKQQSKHNYHKLADRISQQSSYSQHYQHQIEMSHFPSKVKYSRVRLQSSSVILPSTIFYERMNFSAKVETDQSLKIYRQLSNTIQQTINSCNLISCPLKHFLLYFEYKTSKKKINHIAKSQSSNNKLNNPSRDEVNSSRESLNGIALTFNKKTKSSSDSMKHIQINTNDSSIVIIQNQSGNKSSPFIQQSSSISNNKNKANLNINNNNNKANLNINNPNNNDNNTNPSDIMQQDLYQVLIQVSQKSDIIRKKREFNTNYLLKQIKQFTQSYTEFLYKYLNFDKIQQTDLSTFINLDTVYGIVLRNIWSIVNWVADRGYEWEQYALVEVVDNQNPYFQTFNEKQIQNHPSIILKKYAAFCNKDVKKIKTDPIKLCRAYTALLKLKNQVFPQKYLKKIIIFYRQATKCCQGADDLMTLYEFLLKNCILNNYAQQMHIFRMKNIIDKLIPIESSSIDGAGEIVYAWTTWNIILEVFNIKLKQHKKVLMAENEKKIAIHHSNRANTEKKRLIEKNQQKYNLQISPNKRNQNIRNQDNKIKNHENPQRRVDRKLQFTLTSCHEVQQ